MSNPVYISQSASFLPNAPVDNDNMETVLGQVGPKPSRARKTILRSNGIKQRYYAIDPSTGSITHSNAQLAAEAIKQLSSDEFSLDKTDCLVCATSLADQLMPSHAVMVHGELSDSLPCCEVVSTSGVCLSGISALKYAALSIRAGEHDYAIASGSERASMSMRAENFQTEMAQLVEQLTIRPELAFEKDFLRWMLSDGAGALLLQSQKPVTKPSLRIDWIDTFSYAHEMPACMYAGANKKDDGSLTAWGDIPQQKRNDTSVFSVKQDVKLLNENIVHYTVIKPLKKLKEKYDLKAETIDWYLPHYSSHFFKDKLYAGMKEASFEIDESKWFTNLYQKGNTGSASIFIMIDELFKSGKLQHGQRLLCYIPESGRFSSGFMQLTYLD